MATTTKTLDSGIKVQRTEIIGGGVTYQRSTAVRAWQNTRYEAAYEAILEAFPGAFGGHRCMGSIDA